MGCSPTQSAPTPLSSVVTAGASSLEMGSAETTNGRVHGVALAVEANLDRPPLIVANARKREVDLVVTEELSVREPTLSPSLRHGRPERALATRRTTVGISQLTRPRGAGHALLVRFSDHEGPEGLGNPKKPEGSLSAGRASEQRSTRRRKVMPESPKGVRATSSVLGGTRNPVESEGPLPEGRGSGQRSTWRREVMPVSPKVYRPPQASRIG